MTRPQPPKVLPEGWDFTASGLDAWDEVSTKFESALWEMWIAKTRFRNSITLDEPEVRDASQILLVKQDEPKWKLPTRIVAILIAGVGLLAMKESLGIFGSNLNIAILLLIMGALEAVVATVLIGTVLRR